MRDLDHLALALRRLDGRGYKAYKSIQGDYDAGDFALHIDHVQGDPFAEPSRLRVSLPPSTAELPEWTRATARRRISTADFLNRALHRTLARVASRRGSGKSGELQALRPGQEVLERSSVAVGADGSVEARFRAGLPASGRRILGHDAIDMLTGDVPTAVAAALTFEALDAEALRLHVETVEDAQALRAALSELSLVAFVGNDALLPRRSGIDDRPLPSGGTAFVSPAELEVEIATPNSGPVRGMGIRRGVTLIVGGGYHGKSTLLRALERGVYDHLPGDGRERVVTVDTAVKVRAEDGRRVAGTDISAFIGNLPDRQDTTRFVTDNASGSTSQAAAIVEALEVGARCLLVDEDTSATNFMIRDARMQRLIAEADEPITPFIDRVHALAEQRQVSTVLVVGGAGDYFDVADSVIAMRAYQPHEVTADCQRIRAELPAERQPEGGALPAIRQRTVRRSSLDPSRGRRDVSIKTWSEDRVLYGDLEVDLSAVEQIVEVAQARAMAQSLAWVYAEGAEDLPLTELVGRVVGVIDAAGLDAVQPHLAGELAMFRRFELAAFLNRLRTLQTV